MVIYGVEMLPLTTKVQEDISSCIQPWYAYYIGAGGKFDNILIYVKQLCEECESEMKTWVATKVTKWTTSVNSLACIIRTSPYCAFVGITRILQSEWCHLHRV